jgi:hypothetical protein
MDWRKNCETLLAGFGLLPPEFRQAHPLVVTCDLTEDAKRKLGPPPDPSAN